MHLLPLHLGRIAEHAADEDTKFAMSGVRLNLDGDSYVAEATDSTQLVRVSGPCVGDPKDYPDIPAFNDAPNGGTVALVPAAVWRKTFSAAAKLTKKRRHLKPILESVAVKIGDNSATFASTDLVTSPVETTRLIDGRYPPTDEVIPRPSATRARVAVHARRLADLLRTAAEFAGEDAPVILDFNGNRPLAIRSEKLGHKFLALSMPVALPEKEALPEPAEGEAPAADDRSEEIAELDEELQQLRARLATMTERNAALEKALAQKPAPAPRVKSPARRPRIVKPARRATKPEYDGKALVRLWKRKEKGETWQKVAGLAGVPETTLRGRFYRAGLMKKGA